MAPVLGYWKIRGLAHAIRLLFHYKEAEYEEKYYVQGDAPEYSREEWLKEKFTLGLEWPNLPYLMDGDVKMTETSAIFAYLGRKHNLCGSTEEARIRNDMIYSVTTSNRSAFVFMCYNKEHEKMKGPFLESLGGRLEQYSQSLGKRDFFGGSELVYADFCVYDLLDIWNQFEPGCVEKHENLKAYLARIEAIPSIKKFLESEAGMKKGPFNNKIAQWGNQTL